MAIDGFSMGNLGLNAELTSAQMATQSEHIAKRESEIKIKIIDESDKEGEVKRKDEDSEKKNQFDDGFKKKEDQEEESEEQSEDQYISRRSYVTEKDVENNPKEFSVRLNPQTDKIELFNNKNQKVLETINPEDLMFLISKLDSASGVLINRKI